MQQFSHQLTQLKLRILGRWQGYQALMERREIAVQYVKEQLLLAVVIVINQGLGDAASPGHPVDRRAIIAVVCEIDRGLFQDRAAFFAVVLGDRAGHRLARGSVVNNPNGFALRSGDGIFSACAHLRCDADIGLDEGC